MSDTFDFGWGAVPARKHPRGGGWVACTATVTETATVDSDARVWGNAQVWGDAQVSGHAQVWGNAMVWGHAQVWGNAQVSTPILCASRSDGHLFVIAPTQDKTLVIMAGCRYFTLDDARTHWRTTRKGTRLGTESLLLVDHLEAMARLAGWSGKPRRRVAGKKK